MSLSKGHFIETFAQLAKDLYFKLTEMIFIFPVLSVLGHIGIPKEYLCLLSLYLCVCSDVHLVSLYLCVQ